MQSAFGADKQQEESVDYFPEESISAESEGNEISEESTEESNEKTSEVDKTKQRLQRLANLEDEVEFKAGEVLETAAEMGLELPEEAREELEKLSEGDYTGEKHKLPEPESYMADREEVLETAAEMGLELPEEAVQKVESDYEPDEYEEDKSKSRQVQSDMASAIENDTNTEDIITDYQNRDELVTLPEDELDKVPQNIAETMTEAHEELDEIRSREADERIKTQKKERLKTLANLEDEVESKAGEVLETAEEMQVELPEEVQEELGKLSEGDYDGDKYKSRQVQSDMASAIEENNRTNRGIVADYQSQGELMTSSQDELDKVPQNIAETMAEAQENLASLEEEVVSEKSRNKAQEILESNRDFNFPSEVEKSFQNIASGRIENSRDGRLNATLEDPYDEDRIRAYSEAEEEEELIEIKAEELLLADKTEFSEEIKESLEEISNGKHIKIEGSNDHLPIDEVRNILKDAVKEEQGVEEVTDSLQNLEFDLQDEYENENELDERFSDEYDELDELFDEDFEEDEQQELEDASEGQQNLVDRTAPAVSSWIHAEGRDDYRAEGNKHSAEWDFENEELTLNEIEEGGESKTIMRAGWDEGTNSWVDKGSELTEEKAQYFEGEVADLVSQSLHKQEATETRQKESEAVTR